MNAWLREREHVARSIREGAGDPCPCKMGQCWKPSKGQALPALFYRDLPNSKEDEAGTQPGCLEVMMPNRQ